MLQGYLSRRVSAYRLFTALFVGLLVGAAFAGCAKAAPPRLPPSHVKHSLSRVVPDSDTFCIEQHPGFSPRWSCVSVRTLRHVLRDLKDANP